MSRPTERPSRPHGLDRRLLAALLGLVLAGTAWAQAQEIVRVHGVPQPRTAAVVELGDFWGVGRDAGRRYLVMAVDPEQRRAIEALGFATEIDRKRTETAHRFLAVDREAWRLGDQRAVPGFPCYRSVEETHADLAAMATARPDLAQWLSIGQSWLEENGQPGGDDIRVLVLANRNSPHEQAPFLLMAAQHPRELTTAETATRFAEWLLEGYERNATARWLLDHREIHIVAQQNPDGRREVEGGEIWWRKNANQDACPGGSTGVDLNRNSERFWGQYSSDVPCYQTYRGDRPASEPETRAVQDYMDQVFSRQWPVGGGAVPDDAEGLFVSLHSFGRMVLMPWEGSGSGASNNAPNHDQLAWLGRKFGFFTGYDVGRDILYPAGGTMTDQAHGAFGVAAYTFELGTDFHQSCSHFEQAMWPDLLEALLYAAKAARRPYAAPAGPEILDLTAVFDAATGRFRITGTADDTRYDRGQVSEAPGTDPVSEPVEIRASFDLPPDLAANPFVVALPGDTSRQAFAFEMPPPAAMAGPRLLFLQAADRAGDTGVPAAVLVSTSLLFEDRFEPQP